MSRRRPALRTQDKLLPDRAAVDTHNAKTKGTILPRLAPRRCPGP